MDASSTRSIEGSVYGRITYWEYRRKCILTHHLLGVKNEVYMDASPTRSIEGSVYGRITY